MRLKHVGWCALLALAVGARSATTQSVSGTVHDRGTSRPIQGAFVVLLDSAGHRRMGVLTDSTGRFSIGMPAAGAYELHAEMIGYADAVPVRLTLLADTTARVSFQLTPQAIPLAAIDVNAAPRCKLRSDTAGVVLAIWAQARKALTITDWSQGESGLVMVTKRTQQLGWRAPSVLGVDTIHGRSPFETIAPAKIRESGLIYLEKAGWSYYAPGPDYILSDDFVTTHCFAARTRKDMVGLSFEPIRHQATGDIAGTLWLDRTSSALRLLEYEYVHLEPQWLVRSAGGVLRFDRLPSGIWLIPSWEIRLMGYRGASWFASGQVVESWMPLQPSTEPDPVKPPT